MPDPFTLGALSRELFYYGRGTRIAAARVLYCECVELIRQSFDSDAGEQGKKKENPRCGRRRWNRSAMYQRSTGVCATTTFAKPDLTTRH